MAEYLDIVDRSGEPTGEITERTRAHAEGIWHRTSHVWLVRKRDGKVQVLLQKRAADKDSHPGCYDISSAGHIPAGVDWLPSAVRELREELGVTAAERELLYCGVRTVIWDDVFHGKPFRDRQVSRVYMLPCGMEETAFALQESEVESVLWTDLDRCIEDVERGSFPNCISRDELVLLRDAVQKHMQLLDDLAEFEEEKKLLESTGIGQSPLRLEYERKVRELADEKTALFAAGHSEEETAQLLHDRRRQLGLAYKKAAPPLFGRYILYATQLKYGDPLGPDHASLRKRKTAAQIIESASRPIRDLNDRLSAEGFETWFREIGSRFYVTRLDEDLFAKMRGRSWKPGCPVPAEELRCVHLLHKDLNGETHEGELVCHRYLADTLRGIFEQLYTAGYPIEKVRPVDEYDADDERSMADNNSSCFNFRFISHTTTVSKHGLGLAVDINPLYNPYIKTVGGRLSIEPANAAPYIDRTKAFAYKIDEDDLAYRVFTAHGFEWGGLWEDSKDYQHFELPDETVNRLFPGVIGDDAR